MNLDQARSDMTRRKILLRTRGHQCEICKRRMWRGQLIALSLGHIDGNAQNNGGEDLKLLCLNCHGQTPTYAGKNRGKGRADRTS